MPNAEFRMPNAEFFAALGPRFGFSLRSHAEPAIVGRIVRSADARNAPAAVEAKIDC